MSDREKEREHWYRKWTVIGPIFVAALAGVFTLTKALMERDMRNAVYDETYKEKQRVLTTQSDLLQLQERYIDKLSVVRAGERKLEEAEDRVATKEREIESHRVRIRNLLTKYARLGKANQENKKWQRQQEQRRASLAKWSNHYCDIDHSFEINPARKVGESAICSYGAVAIFAKNTPDEKVVVPRRATCTEEKKKEFDLATSACEKYAEAFLLGKGLSEGDLQELELLQLVSRFNEIRNLGDDLRGFFSLALPGWHCLNALRSHVEQELI